MFINGNFNCAYSQYLEALQWFNYLPANSDFLEDAIRKVDEAEKHLGTWIKVIKKEEKEEEEVNN